jgi:hypothetical protein
MGKKENSLKEVVYSIYGNRKHLKPSSSELLESKYSKHIYEIYSTLGGILSEPPTQFGSWDISTNNFIIELDEERHFNRYRLRTLESPFYLKNNFFSLTDYKKYSKEKENACLKSAQHGGYWKNDSTERQFPKSNTNGILDGNGSSRWKQRAYYDFLKDISSKIIAIPLIRISIYDEYKGYTLEQILKRKEYNLLAELINLKISNYISLFEINEVLPNHVLEGIARGQEDVKAGRTITFEEFKKRLSISK